MCVRAVCAYRVSMGRSGLVPSLRADALNGPRTLVVGDFSQGERMTACSPSVAVRALAVGRVRPASGPRHIDGAATQDEAALQIRGSVGAIAQLPVGRDRCDGARPQDDAPNGDTAVVDVCMGTRNRPGNIRESRLDRGLDQTKVIVALVAGVCRQRVGWDEVRDVGGGL